MKQDDTGVKGIKTDCRMNQGTCLISSDWQNPGFTELMTTGDPAEDTSSSNVLASWRVKSKSSNLVVWYWSTGSYCSLSLKALSISAWNF